MKKILIAGLGLFFAFILIVGSLFGSSGQNCDVIDMQSPGAGSSGDWTKKDSQVYKNMMFAVEKLKALGFSGDQTAIILATGYKESGFDPLAMNPGGGVAGIFQWSGWSHNVNGNRITAEGSIKAGDKSTLTIENQFKLLKYELHGPYKKVYTDMLATKTMDEVEFIWSTHFEGLPAHDEAQRKKPKVMSDAQSIKKALKLDFASSGNHSELTQDAIENAKKMNEAMADGGDSMDCGPRGAVGGQKSGAPTQKVPKEWADKVKFPDDRSVTYSDNKYPFGQCTWYVYNRMKQVGSHIEWFSGSSGDGANWGTSAMRAGGYSVKKDKPEVGTAVSMKGGQYDSVAPYGHIAFVEAVNDDGSFLVSEANVVNPGSGTVSFRVIPSGKGLTFITGK